MSAVVMAIASIALCIRVYAIHDRSKVVLATLAPLLFLQIAAQSVGSGFYKVIPLKVGQGCISGPKYTWVGVSQPPRSPSH